MNPLNALTEYLRSSKQELEKVSWPSRQDTIRYSSLVLGVSLVVAAFFASLDFGLNRLVDAALQSRSASQTQSAPAASTPSPSDVPAPAPTPAPAGVPGLDVQGVDNTVVPKP